MVSISTSLHEELKSHIRDVPDFPKKGIIFKDITPLLANGGVFKDLIQHLALRYQSKNIDAIVGVDARGFLISSALSNELGKGVVPIRKKGKLPSDTYSVTYDLEYGQDTLEIHKDALKKGSKVVLVDDVLATGGTIAASIELLKNISIEIVEVVFLIELEFLRGRDKISDVPIYSLVKY